MKLSLEQTLQEERRLRIQTEQAFYELKEKYDILLAKSKDISTNPDADYIRNQYLRSYRT